MFLICLVFAACAIVLCLFKSVNSQTKWNYIVYTIFFLKNLISELFFKQFFLQKLKRHREFLLKLNIYIFLFSGLGWRSPLLPWDFTVLHTMILQCLRIIVGDAGFEPGTSATEEGEIYLFFLGCNFVKWIFRVFFY